MGINFIGKYHLWAGNESRKQLEKLTDEEFSQDFGSTIGSIRDKVEHILLAMEFCFKRVINDSSAPEETVNRIKNMSNQALLKHWEHRDKKLANALQQDMDGIITIQRMNESSFVMNLEDFYLQYVLHTVYHRGQVNYCLKKLNKDRIDADYLYYFDELNFQEHS
ncbi:MAG: DinB family protein [Candidatus Hodarchaeales archaeon]|jgi:uncharacterized damage-inducible protein DinB